MSYCRLRVNSKYPSKLGHYNWYFEIINLYFCNNYMYHVIINIRAIRCEILEKLTLFLEFHIDLPYKSFNNVREVLTCRCLALRIGIFLFCQKHLESRFLMSTLRHHIHRCCFLNPCEMRSDWYDVLRNRIRRHPICRFVIFTFVELIQWQFNLSAPKGDLMFPGKRTSLENPAWDYILYMAHVQRRILVWPP